MNFAKLTLRSLVQQPDGVGPPVAQRAGVHLSALGRTIAHRGPAAVGKVALGVVATPIVAVVGGGMAAVAGSPIGVPVGAVVGGITYGVGLCCGVDSFTASALSVNVGYGAGVVTSIAAGAAMMLRGHGDDFDINFR